MPISEAKLQANCRNAQRSSGPRTEEGKRRSSLNAVTHGLRAETLVLLDEDPHVLDDRREAWRACLLPGDDVEERLVESAVVHTWMQDRARRAQAGRINANITNYGVDQDQSTEEEVVALGRRLFKDRLGPLVSYPTGSMKIGIRECRGATTSYAGQRDDPDVPIDLVLRLQSTLLGCEWLLAEWARLKTILDQGQPWVASDKLKAVRLLGKQPFDAIDDKDVAMMFLASFVLKGHRGGWDWEIIMETNSEEIVTFRQNAATRQLESLTPSDATKAREVLLEIIERATQRLTTRAEAHRERARVMAALATDFLAFDDSPDGERLRRFDLASGRGLSRSLDDLRKHRRPIVSSPLPVVSSPLSVVRGPWSVAGYTAEAITEAIATNEPTGTQENVTNEPNSGPLSVVRCPLPAVRDTVVSQDEPDATNEATEARENATSEPTESRQNVTNEPTEPRQNVTNEPTEPRQNVTNEPTQAFENVTNEPTEAQENATSEPTVAADREDGKSAELRAGTCDRNDDRLETEFDPEKAVESYRQGVERRKAAREERTRELNAEARLEAEKAMAVRRAGLREQKKQKNGKPGNPPTGHHPSASLSLLPLGV